MTVVLSANTQAILMLTAPLIAGRGTGSPDLLSPGEYKRLARHLREIKRQPADLVSADAVEILRDCQSVFEESRLQRLLGRGFMLSQAIERWQARAMWVVSRADVGYPRRLKVRLREDAPAVLYGCGDVGLLETGGLAVVGSRHVAHALIDYTLSVGKMAAHAGRTLVSGGAKGIDQAAMRGALEAGGRVCGVLADSLEKTALNREHRNALLDGQLTLISPYDPSAGFNVGHAMQRNKLIYALSDAALVVSSDLNQGGTWAGAIEQLDKLGFVPVYVRSTGDSSAGLDALRKAGALPWPNPEGLDAFEHVFDASAPSMAAPQQSGLSWISEDEPVAVAPSNSAVKETPAEYEVVSESLLESLSSTEHQNKVGLDEITMTAAPADVLFAAVRDAIQRLLTRPMKDAEIAAALDVSNAQAKAWLQRLVDDGVIVKRGKLAGYVVKPSKLFE